MYPGPHPQQYVYQPRPLFRDSRSLVRTAVILWVLAGLGTLIGGLVQAAHRAHDLERYKAGEIPASRLDNSFRFGLVAGGTTFLTAVLGIAGLVLVIVATFRLAKNHQALGRPGTTFGPGWAVAGWLIPLANAVIPYLQARDLWRGSDPDLGLDAVDWRARRTHRAIGVACALAVAAAVLAVVIFIWVVSTSFDAFDTVGRRDQFRVDLAQAAADMRPLQAVAGVLSLLGTIVMAWVLVQLAARQQVLAERLRLVGPDGQPQIVPPAYAPTFAPFTVAHPPGWYADPWRRAQLRWWDGTNWSPHVSSDGVTAYDPPSGVPPAPPG